MENYNEQYRNEKLERAKEKIKELKGFYIHLTVFILVNLFIVGSVIFSSGWNGFLNIGTYFTPFFWGIGLVAHYSKVHGSLPFFSKDWEKRQIEKYMEKEKRESDDFLKKK
ncbi:2TM domain-containing protein [Cellulophaga lytica]|nr:2TM domain-containing protein [Cellulophaga lytica]